jgi:hypothetical protein
MSKSTPASRVRITYDFIKAHSTTYPVQTLCRMLNVAPSGYYAWLEKPLPNRALEDARLVRLIRASFVASQGIYGAPCFSTSGRRVKPVASTASLASCASSGCGRSTATARDGGRSASPRS